MYQVPRSLTFPRMTSGPMPAKVYFPRVKEAREALKDKALEILEKQSTIVDLAIAKEDYETAGKLNQWLIEHMPKGDNGETIIDESAATPKELASGPTGPTIQIGIQLGAPPPTKQLSSPVIDISPLESLNDSHVPPRKADPLLSS